jgi:hypothetical protein
VQVVLQGPCSALTRFLSTHHHDIQHFATVSLYCHSQAPPFKPEASVEKLAALQRPCNTCTPQQASAYHHHILCRSAILPCCLSQASPSKPEAGVGTCNLYFKTPAAPLPDNVLYLNGTGQGLVNNCCFPSTVAPSYAPRGQVRLGRGVG